jgi:hypothetical protein
MKQQQQRNLAPRFLQQFEQQAPKQKQHKTLHIRIDTDICQNASQLPRIKDKLSIPTLHRQHEQESRHVDSLGGRDVHIRKPRPKKYILGQENRRNVSKLDYRNRREALTRTQREKLCKMADTIPPVELKESYDFECLVSYAIVALEYIDSVFACVLGRPLESGNIPNPPESEEEIEVLKKSMLMLAEGYWYYWMEHFEEITNELELSSDDASPDRLPTSVVLITVISTAKATAFALGENDTYREVTALSFNSIRKQLLAQTPKMIKDYTATDMIEAMDAISHAWNRVKVTDEIFEYIDALLIRFGVMMRCATIVGTGIKKADGEDDDEDERSEASKFIIKSADSIYGLPRLKFREEMAYRFKSFTESRWILSKHSPEWSVTELASLLYDHSLNLHDAKKKKKDSESSTGGGGESDLIAKKKRKIVNERDVMEYKRNPAGNGNRDVDEPRVFDPKKASRAVLEALCAYTKETKGSDTIAEAFRGKYMDYMVCPGDEGVFRVDNPTTTPSTKNVVKYRRGNRFYSATVETSLLDTQLILEAAIERIYVSGRGMSENAYCTRSDALVVEEIVGSCAMDCLMKGKYTVDWFDRFVITRSIYRSARQLGFLEERAVPVIIIAANSYDVLFKGRLLRTSSLFESIAWWLEIIRVMCKAELPATLTAYRGIVTALMDPEKSGIANIEDNKMDFFRKKSVQDSKILEGEDGRMTESTAMNACQPTRRKRRCQQKREPRSSTRLINEGDDPRSSRGNFIDDYEEEEEKSECTHDDIKIELERKTTKIDLRELCDIPTLGAEVANFRTDLREHCKIIPLSGEKERQNDGDSSTSSVISSDVFLRQQSGANNNNVLAFF